MSADAPLSGLESFALQLGRVANEKSLAKAAQHRFLRGPAYAWMRPAMSRRTYVDNIDYLIPAPSDRGVLFACNHRSYFDYYLVLFALYARKAKWPQKLYFPVRSDFFYDSIPGMIVNFAVGGGVMYPPIYREKSKRHLNTDAVERVTGWLDTPCSLVGLHPEGKRNTGNPYELLPAQPGAGQIILKAKPLVVPVFVNGLSNNFVESIRQSFEPDAHLRHPIIISFGDPRRLRGVYNSAPTCGPLQEMQRSGHEGDRSVWLSRTAAPGGDRQRTCAEGRSRLASSTSGK